MSNTKPMDKITAHFRNKIGGKMRSTYVEEWDTTIYFKEANTLREEGRMLELAQQGKAIEALVETLVVKAKNEDGTNMFTLADRTVLLNEADPKVIIRVVTEINNANEESNLEFAEKN